MKRFHTQFRWMRGGASRVDECFGSYPTYLLLNRSVGALLLVAVLILCGCDDDGDKYELINKLRGVGIDMQPPIVSGAQSVEIEIVAALPKGQTISSVSVYQDQQVDVTWATTISLAAEDRYTEKGPLTIFTKSASVQVPAVESALLEQLNGVAKMRIGFKLVSGSEEEILVADILSVAAGDESLTWTSPNLTVDSPKDGDSLSVPYDLQSTLVKNREERVKTVWFISSGTLENSLALDTQWKDAEVGEQTLIKAMYAQESRFFSYQALQVQVQ